MAPVVDLERWRRERRGSGPACRLDAAVSRLERVLADRGWERRAPGWVMTELLAIQGAVSLGMTEEAAARAESLADRSTPRRARR
jgi:hypothetical protein